MYVFLWLLFAIFSAMIANGKGRSGLAWFLVGLLLGPFGLLVAFLPPLNAKEAALSSELDQLKTLSELRKDGTLSEKEFLERKAAITVGQRENIFTKQFGVRSSLLILLGMMIVITVLSAVFKVQ